MLIDRRPTRTDGRRSSAQAAGSPLAPGTAAAVAAFVIGTIYAGVSAYWGFGGTGLLNTVGGALERQGRAGATTIRVLLWLAVLLKLGAAVLGLLAVAPPGWVRDRRRRLARRAAWICALFLAGYGAVLTSTGLLVQLRLLHASAIADQTALRWHAFVWDPWFLLWGVVLTTALARSRSDTPMPPARSRQPRTPRRAREG